MKRLVYSPKYRIKILQLKAYLDDNFGLNTRRSVLKEITRRLHMLQDNEYRGVSLKELYGINTDYRYVFIEHNYVFYRVDGTYVYIVDIYNEREDFLLRLFGIPSVSDNTEEEGEDDS